MQMLQLRAMENLWKKHVGHNFDRHSWPTLSEFKNALRHTAAPVSESFIYKLFFIIHPFNTRKKKSYQKDWFCSEFHRFLCHSYFEEFEGENATPLDSEEFIDIVIFILYQDSQYHVSYLFSSALITKLAK